jgi:hypothetical protein
MLPTFSLRTKMPTTRRTLVLAALMAALAGCQDFLAVNENPNGPTDIEANLYLPSILHHMVTGPQFDGRYIGQYTQQWMVPANAPGDQFDRMFSPQADSPGEVWRVVYWLHGQNLIDLMNKSQAEQRWDLLGIGYTIKAWDWLQATDLHGEIPMRQAFEPDRYRFDYDSQEVVYTEVQRLLDSAIVNLGRTGGKVDAAYVARGDKMYNGDRAKWLRFAHGLRAMTLNHYSNKASYQPAAVIAAVDLSFQGNADDAMFLYPGVQADVSQDNNFWGQKRGNLTTRRQTRFILELLNGTQLGAADPRLTRMLSPAPDGQYRGLDPQQANFGTLAVDQRPNLLWGYPTQTAALANPGRYIFDDKARVPLMTYAQLQFIKAEAALRSGDAPTALTAYRNGVAAHIDFVNARNAEAGGATQITAAEKAAFLANPAIIPTSAGLTLTMIMSQKYIAQWAWGHTELWMDMRRYAYTNLDPATGTQVYPGFNIPPTTNPAGVSLHPDNLGKPVQRIRPRFNSEYVWNRESLSKIGGLNIDFHTYPLWITQP